MSWGVSYKYDGYIYRTHKNQVESRITECKAEIDRLWSEILAYMSATPPDEYSDGDFKEPSPVYIARRLAEYREELEEQMYMLVRLEQCHSVMQDNPENVEDD